MKHLFYLLITFWFIPLAAQQSQTARHMENLGFVNIAEADSTIAIDLMYTRASPDGCYTKICTRPICPPTP